MRNLLIAFTALLCLAGSATAFAELSEEEREQARALYEEAADCYNLGQYNCALDKWTEVYEISEEPAILYNLGNTQERLGNLGASLELLQDYREHAPLQQLPVLDSRIENLQTRIAEQDALEDERRANQERLEREAAERAREAELEAERARQLEERQEELSRELQEAQQAAGNRAPKGLRITRWSLLGVGIAGVVTGAGVQIYRSGLQGDLEDTCGRAGSDWLCPTTANSDLSSFENAKTGVVVGYTVGAAALTGALVTFLINPNRDSAASDSGEAAWNISPTFDTRGGAGVQFDARF